MMTNGKSCVSSNDSRVITFLDIVDWLLISGCYDRLS